MSRGKIKKLFIANRGEIAARITRSAKELGITTVITYTANDCNSLHVQLADKAVSLGNKSLSETYLSPEKMVEVAKNEQCDAVHPGYGFLSENDRFAELCQQNGLLFIGPSTQTIRKMGDKKEAKKLAQQCGVPVLENLVLSKESNINGSSIPEFPLLIKAVAGGGGKGMYIVENFKELDFKVEQAKRETINYFGNGQLYIETYIKNARHIEIQLLGDNFGNLIHLFERECSLQRRHQKIIEEAPASSISEGLRNKLIQAALKIGKAVNYSGAGTVEFLVDADENFYFLEMNTRIQVEHGVTEIVTGIDIVKEQLLIASGKKLSFSQEEIKISGFAIEARVYAENPLNNFIPVSGELVKIKFPETTGSRIDTHLQLPHHLPAEYDALLAKLIGFGESREMAKKTT